MLVQWLVDTRALWPEAVQTRDLTEQPGPKRALAALLSDEARAAVTKYFFVRDAKMALASQLLKQYAVARLAGVPWRAARIARDVHGKPVFRDSTDLVFNVSHQAGLVALIAVHGPAAATLDVGIDVVSPAERRTRDHAMLDEAKLEAKLGADHGWHAFVDMHADVLAPGEVRYLKTRPGDGSSAGKDGRLRYFYALWCLREAYVKMTGEALLAPWLADLEFRAFTPPAADDGAMVTTHDVVFHGRPVTDARLCLRSVGSDYMVCTAVRSATSSLDKTPGLALPIEGAFETITMDEILAFAACAM